MRRPVPFAALALALPLVLGLALGTGCYFTRSPSRPLPALAFLRDPGVRQECLVIFVPGYLDGPDTYREHGFPRDLVQSDAPCDSVAVDLHARYYARTGVADILYEDVVVPALARGYDDIWVVGISMGGLGATLLARSHPEAIDGLVLLSPFLGEPAVIREIEAAGGLATWHPPADLSRTVDDSNYTLHLWSWLRGYVDDPDAMPPLFLAWAEGERLAPVARVLGDALPEGHTLVAEEGAHDWATWRPLFRALLPRARIGRASATPPGGERTWAAR